MEKKPKKRGLKGRKRFILLFVIGILIFLYPTFSNLYYYLYVEFKSAVVESASYPESSSGETNTAETPETVEPSEDPSPEVGTENPSTISSNEYVSIKRDPEMKTLLNKNIEYLIAYNNTIVNGSGTVLDPFGNDIGEAAEEIFAQADKNTIFGYIDMPKINQKLPIYLGATKEHLHWGAAVVQGTSIPIGGINTNSVISAHTGAVRTLFTHIPRLVPGDEIIITSSYGTLVYKVTGNKLIMPEEMEYLSIVPGKDMITLLTCYNTSKEDDRFLVFAERTSGSGSVPVQTDAPPVVTSIQETSSPEMTETQQSSAVETESRQQDTTAFTEETTPQETEFSYVYNTEILEPEEPWYEKSRIFLMGAAVLLVLIFLYFLLRKEKSE